MPPETAPARLLASASEVLNAWGIRWYVFGAQAAAVWGRPRMTADVDITVKLEPEDSARFCQDMERAGFKLRVVDRDDFLARTRVIPLLHVETQMPLDVVLAGPGIEEMFLSRAVQVDIDGVSVPVASPEDVIVMKVMAGRPKDQEDVATVLRERWRKLDLEYIRDTLRLLEQALDQSDLLPAFEAQLKRVQQTRVPGVV